MEAAPSFSSRFIQQAEEERTALLDHLKVLRDQADDLASKLRECEAEIEETAALVREVEDILGVSAQMRLEVPTYRIGGKALREAAVRVLISRSAEGPVHYKKWLEWLEEDGYRVAGENPAATFLAQIVLDPRVERVGNKTGKYQLVT